MSKLIIKYPKCQKCVHGHRNMCFGLNKKYLRTIKFAYLIRIVATIKLFGVIQNVGIYKQSKILTKIFC